MEDFGNIIYIVITIILLAASALRKKKKPNQRQQPKKRSVTDSVFDDIFGVDTKTSEQDIFESISANRAQRYESVPEPPTFSEKTVPEKSKQVEKKDTRIFTFEEKQEEEEYYRNKEPFDLKDAVIKSIILERKHF